MLNLVVLSLAIVASKAALSCNGASFTIGTMETVVAAGLCTGAEAGGQVSSAQYVCKGGKINIAAYTSSSDCTGDSQEAEVCSNAAYTDCTSVCGQDPCGYIKVQIYSGVTSCDPIVVSSSSNVNYHITGQCLSISHHPTINSTSMLCDSSSGTAQYVMYTSDDCTGPSILSINLTATCSVDNDHALTYSCGTANDVHTPETTIEEVKGNIEDFGTSINPSDVSSFGIFVVMVFVVGMLSWM
eukprot:489869_1